MEESKEHQIGKELPGAPEFDGNRLLALVKPGASSKPGGTSKGEKERQHWVHLGWKSLVDFLSSKFNGGQSYFVC